MRYKLAMHADETFLFNFLLRPKVNTRKPIVSYPLRDILNDKHVPVFPRHTLYLNVQNVPEPKDTPYKTKSV